MKTLTDIFSLPEGSVLISYPSQMDQDSIKDVVDWLSLVSRKIERHSQQQQQQEDNHD